MGKEKLNHNFVQIYREHIPELRWLMKKSGIASSILMFIIEHMDNGNALCCSHSVLMDYFDISKPTVTRAIKLLKENGFIDVLKSGTSNVYIVNSSIAWTSWNNKREYCKFNGAMLISKSENKDFYYKSNFERFKELRLREGIKTEKDAKMAFLQDNEDIKSIKKGL